MIHFNIWNFIWLFRTELMYACENGHIDIVKLLLKQKEIEINAKSVSLYSSELIHFV